MLEVVRTSGSQVVEHHSTTCICKIVGTCASTIVPDGDLCRGRRPPQDDLHIRLEDTQYVILLYGSGGATLAEVGAEQFWQSEPRDRDFLFSSFS